MNKYSEKRLTDASVPKKKWIDIMKRKRTQEQKIDKAKKQLYVSEIYGHKNMDAEIWNNLEYLEWNRKSNDGWDWLETKMPQIEVQTMMILFAFQMMKRITTS